MMCQATDYYVTPNDSSNPDCPVGEPCFTFDHYAQEFRNTSYNDGKLNITLIFLQGTHNLTQHFGVSHSEANSLVLRGISDVPSVIVLLNADISSHGPVTKVMFKSLRIGEVFHTVTIHQANEIILEQVVFSNTLLYIRSNGFTDNMQVVESVFICSGIDVDVAYQGNFHISIMSSSLSSGPSVNLSPMYIRGERTTIALQMYNTTIEDDSLCRPFQIVDRTAPFCDLRIYAHKVLAVTCNITESKFLHSPGAAICILTYQSNYLDVQITDSTISNHRAGALFVSINDANFRPNINITMKNCSIFNNTLESVIPASAGISIISDATFDITSALQYLRVVIENSTFFNNHAHEASGVISLLRVTHVTIHNCEFLNNTGSPIMAYQSTLTLSGNVSFVGNIAVKGGALSLTLSTINITDGSNIVFKNNSATDVGGAIYVEQLSANIYLDNVEGTAAQCFYQLLGKSETGNYSLTFADNTAMHGGDHVFGTSLQSYCIAGYVHVPDGEFLTSICAQEFFHFHPNQTLALSAVSSLPTRICLCNSDGQFNCENASEIFRNVRAAPGEEFYISAVIVGGQFGTARGSVYAQFLPLNGYEASLSQRYQYTQGIRDHKKCTQLNYTILSANEREVVVLTAIEGTVSTYGDIDTLQEYVDTFEKNGVIPPHLLTTPVYINVTMLPCPMGFIPNGNPPRCDCYQIFKDNYISCRISGGGNGYVTRNGTLWVNASFDEAGNSTGVFVHKYCPFGYCDPQQVTVDLTNPDTQCAFNRSGILCGSCKQGYSTTLGSSKCLQCSNNYLALLLVFGVAGILLVLFIKLLDLTVAHGTINGLIFYANIVWANQSILFPNDGYTNYTLILKTFIAWFNLDFGFETCFVDGLDGYWKTWLQFVFPFYIWSIAGVIIITSRHSALLTKLFGNNSVPVLATLFLLSYSKLLRTIITAMNVTYLVDYPNGYRLAVWSFDGNLKYCGVPHVFLFIFALVVLLVLWMPYTSVLLSIQLLRKVSELKFFRWVDKMKPIFDAYFSPFKDRHHYWVGVQLIARGILLITFSLTSSNIPAANYIAMTAVSAVLLFSVAQTGHLYKKLYVSFLETTFLLNLVLLGGGALFVNLTEGNETALIFISVGISFVQFIIILLIHLKSSIKLCYKKYKHVNGGEEYENLEEADVLPNRRQKVSTSHVDRQFLQASEDYSKFREPLLEESTS